MGRSLLDINDRLGEHAPSWYAATSNDNTTFPSAEGNLTFDVCIVGAGYSGLSTALHLSDLGYKVCVFEAHRVGWGASGRSGGQLGSGQRREVQDLEKLVGKTAAKEAFDIGVDATRLVRALIEKHKIECGYQSGIIDAFHRKSYGMYAQEEVDHYARNYGYDSLSFLTKDALFEKVGSPDFHGGIVDSFTGHLHPLNYAKGLANAAVKAGAQIFELNRVTSLNKTQKWVVKTENAAVTSDHVVLAANGYLGELDNKVASHIMPINNFIAVTQPLEESICNRLIRDREAVCDTRFVVNYFRLTHDNRLLFGGGENYSYRFPRDIASMVRRRFEKIYPIIKGIGVDYAWGGTLAITSSRLPYFEFRSDGLANISGYSGSGIHMATMAGKITAEAINGQTTKFDVMAGLPTPKLPGGSLFRAPLMALALTWYSLMDRL